VHNAVIRLWLSSGRRIQCRFYWVAAVAASWLIYELLKKDVTLTGQRGRR